MLLMSGVSKNGGRGGIRTHVRVSPKPDFESGAFNHSATLPVESSAVYFARIRMIGKLIRRNFASKKSGWSRTGEMLSMRLCPTSKINV
jgi:hypothetical protein